MFCHGCEKRMRRSQPFQKKYSFGFRVSGVPSIVTPGRTDTLVPRMDPVPALGEHTDAILGELGWTAPDIARLRETGAI